MHRLIDMCIFKMPERSLQDAYLIYSYARIRSRFKLCCRQRSMRQSPRENVLALLLRQGEDRLPLADINAYQIFIKSAVWLFKGEIGTEEMRGIECTEESASSVWSWTFASGAGRGTLESLIPIGTHMTTPFPPPPTHSSCDLLHLQSSHFCLLLEKGCYVGREVGSLHRAEFSERCDTALSKYLFDLIDGSTEIGTKFEHHDIVINACATVIKTSTFCLSSIQGGSRDESSTLRARMRFCFRGEFPDLSGEASGTVLSSTSFDEVRRTTVLHDAIFSCCYSAVEYFVLYRAIPLMVRDCNEETGLDLAMRMRRIHQAKPTDQWRLIQPDAIIGLLSQFSKVTNPDVSLPLGWEKVDFGGGLIAFHESTVNPQNPSVTFEQPKFSLLQETQITLGSKEIPEDGLTYKFDLVRFIHNSRIEERNDSNLIFDESWYSDDMKELEGESRSLFVVIRDRFWRTTRSGRFLPVKIVLFRSYVNSLLIFVPISIIYRALNWDTPNTVVLFCMASLAIVPLIDIVQSSLNDMRQPGHRTDGSD